MPLAYVVGLPITVAKATPTSLQPPAQRQTNDVHTDRFGKRHITRLHERVRLLLCSTCFGPQDGSSSLMAFSSSTEAAALSS